MKRFLSFLLLFLAFSSFSFAQEYEDDIEPDYEDDVYIYDTNGAGDRFLKINLGGLFPLNFKHQLKVGGEATIGFYYFLTKQIAVGGELAISYNLSIGNKILIMIPITGGIMFQPSIDKFEFPIFAQIGIGTQTWQNMEKFPTLTTKLSAGAYYRITDSVSFGLSTDFFWVPEWYKDSSKIFNGLFESASIGLRYHF